MADIPVFSELVDLIANANPQKIAGFQASAETLQRAQYLVTQKNEGALTTSEEQELNYFVYLENMIGLAKARAYQILASA